MKKRLESKVAIVTGASRGIGECVARRLAAEGARVVLVSRTLETLEEVAESINAEHPESAWAKDCHMGEPDSVRALVEWVRTEVGLPNVLVNNAATNPYFGPFLDVEEAAWDKTFEVNVKGYFEAARWVAKALIDAKAPGSIINMSSVFGLRAAPLQGVYAMTKAAVVSMSRTLAAELGPAGIRVNTVCPGLVETKFARVIVETPEFSQRYTDRAALGRWAQPEELSGIVAYLASDDASFTTGQEFVIDGGYTTMG